MKSAAKIDVPLVFVGGGNMAEAIVRGGVRAGCIDSTMVCVAEPDGMKRERFGEIGVRAYATATEAIRAGGDGCAIVLAVKPQMLGDVAKEIVGVVGKRLVITILAGTPSEKVRRVLGDACRVVRVMPNLPASIGQGATAVARGAGADEADVGVALSLFSSVGSCVERIDEHLMDAFTAIAGSGPAYLFYLAEAMTEAAVRFGFGLDAAARIVNATLAGSGGLLAASEVSAAGLREAVTSKGGTTFAATSTLDDGGAKELLWRAMDAARARGGELSKM